MCMYVWKTFESLLLVMGEERLTFDNEFVFGLAPMSQIFLFVSLLAGYC